MTLSTSNSGGPLANRFVDGDAAPLVVRDNELDPSGGVEEGPVERDGKGNRNGSEEKLNADIAAD